MPKLQGTGEVTSFVAQFLATLVFVFLKAFQQRNVSFDNFGWVMPTSFLMAGCEVFVIANVAQTGFEIAIVLASGLGGGIGAVLGAKFHKKYVKR